MQLLLSFLYKIPPSWRDALPHWLQRKVKILLQHFQLNSWNRANKPVPPPHIVKVRSVEEFKNKYSLDTLVETGTYMGDMIDSVLHSFSNIYSIELDTKLHSRAKKIFSGYAHVILLQGDSGKQIKIVLQELSSPALFWLDAHYSGGITAKGESDTPIESELKAIFKTGINHIILIDDARHFTGKLGYPTIPSLRKLISQRAKDYQLSVENDIIQLYPKQ